MRGLRWFAIVSLLNTIAGPLAALAQEATPVPAFGVAESWSPADLYDVLLATPFPADLLPAGADALEPYEWRDSNDPDLAGSMGGVIFADGDPFGSQRPSEIAYLIYPDSAGPRTPLATAAQFGEPAELVIENQVTPAVLAETEDFVGLFTAIDNVLVSGMAPLGNNAEQAATLLAAAGVAHLLDLAAGHATSSAAIATPDSGAPRSGEDPFLEMAAAPFPAAEIPFPVGALVVLPMDVSSGESAGGLIGALLVRDADRIYPYPLVIYQFFANETAARDAFSSSERCTGTVSEAEWPPDVAIPYPTTILDQTNDSTRVLVQAGAAIVIGNAAEGDLEARHATALTLAQIAVTHLEDVIGAEGDDGNESSTGGNGSPEQMYEALLAATFPEELLPQGVAPLETRPWQDASDPVLAGAVGGMTFSNGDATALEPVNSISVAVFPDTTAAADAFAAAVSQVESLGEAPQPCAEIETPSVEFVLAIAYGCVVLVDNVVISGSVLALDERTTDQKLSLARSLAQAGVAFVQQMTNAG